MRGTRCGRGWPPRRPMADVSERAIMAQTGHKSLPMVRRYIRDGSLFRRNAAAAVGLKRATLWELGLLSGSAAHSTTRLKPASERSPTSGLAEARPAGGDRRD